ncbi:hypothetical protein P7K49_031590 [Saguinus oedipus]|uniref:Uncharacterized protein n=1 Tax=Saguinus oedipus TaxID=9490 RepID=A0ABQ9TZV0_SAGOE|nr:hypothetical protein P7K49_031590 [Saguinus oedipus]
MTSGVYRPPGARLTTTRKTPQGPPEIYSDTQFPSLQSTAKHVESRKIVKCLVGMPILRVEPNSLCCKGQWMLEAQLQEHVGEI